MPLKTGQLTLNVKKEETVKIGQVIGYIETDAKPPTGEPPPVAAKEQKPPPPEPKKIEGESARVMMGEFASSVKEGVKKPPPQQQPKIIEGRTTRKKMSNLRKVIAARLVEAKNTTAMLTTFNEVDMSQ